MTVRPVFVRPEKDDGRERNPSLGLSLAGSCLLVSPRLALTCDHVTRIDPQSRLDGEMAPHDIVVGTSGRPVRQIIRAAADADDLALLELAEPEPFTPAVFSRQWQLDHVHALGFRYAPFRSVERDGPIVLGHREHVAGMARSVGFTQGVQNGFSGGPLEGRFQGVSYCIGLSCYGGAARAMGVFIPAVACAAFVESCSRTKCNIVDLAPKALLDLLALSERRLEEAWCAGDLGEAVLVWSGPFEVTNAPLVRVDAINRSARPALERGELPDRLAIAVGAKELEAFLASHHADGEPADILCRYFEQSEPRLRFTEALRECLMAGNVLLAVTGYEAATRSPDASDPLSTFLIAMRRMLAANEARRRRS
jgi:hypothetical protein